MLRGIVGALNTEFRSLEPRGPRGTEALAAAISVTLAVLAALLLHSDEPWWAAISAWMVMRSSLAVALSRGAMRIIGSAVGAAIAVIVIGLFVYDPLPFCLCLFALACAGLFGFATSRHGYAWLIASDHRQSGHADGTRSTANQIYNRREPCFRCHDRHDSGVARHLSASADTTAPSPAPTPPTLLPLLFWTRRHAAEFERWLREIWPLVLHAFRGGLTVMLLPLLVNWLAPLGPSTMAVTAVAVMAVPTTAVIEPDARTIIQRAVYRLVGCALGARAGSLLSSLGRLQLPCLAVAIDGRDLAQLADPIGWHWYRLCRDPGRARVSIEHDPGSGPAAFPHSGARPLRRNHGGALGVADHHDGGSLFRLTPSAAPARGD